MSKKPLFRRWFFCYNRVKLITEIGFKQLVKGVFVMAMKMKLNKEELRDKIFGCWIGKNLGGTIGGPFEGNPELLDIKGFSSPKGEPLPNDDLDLQLVWLRAMEDVGPKALNANVLADYWLSYIAPDFNEYGTGKTNLRMGLLPPLSGEVNNELWHHSNGAWIRSEVWACMAPGVPNIAVKYAIMDGSIDHGLAEGTCAEIFTAALESIAFFETDVRTVIDKALSYVPADSRVARSIKIVLDGYDTGKDWKDTRNAVVEDSRDLGMFMGPANVAFAVLGLVYGEGDFKKSMLYSVNCGDDTDCTAATCGSVMGIMRGAKNIPEDWKEYIGDSIKNICVNGAYRSCVAHTCTELTDRVIAQIPVVLQAYGIEVEMTDEESSMEDVKPDEILKGYAEEVLKRSPYSFEVKATPHTDAVVEYEKPSIVKAGEDFKVKVSFRNWRRNPLYLDMDVRLPDGWTADYSKTVFAIHDSIKGRGEGFWEMTIHVGENVEAINRIPVIVWARGNATPVFIPIVLLG